MCVGKYKIYYKSCSLCVYKHYKQITTTLLNTRITFDCIQPYNKYMNNSLMSYGPRLWNELIIDKQNWYLFPFSVIIFLIIC